MAAGLEAGRRLRESAKRQARERLEFAPRGFFEIGRRNIGGQESIGRPLHAPESPAERRIRADRRGPIAFGFAEYRIVGTYREPRAFGVNADLSFTAAVEQGVRSSFNFARKGVNAERRPASGAGPARERPILIRHDPHVRRDSSVSRTNRAIDRIFPQVRLSAFAGGISRDTRDDVLDPERGTFVSAEGTLATRALGGQVGFIKSYVQGFWFRRLPVKRRVVFASRVAWGSPTAFRAPCSRPMRRGSR